MVPTIASCEPAGQIRMGLLDTMSGYLAMLPLYRTLLTLSRDSGTLSKGEPVRFATKGTGAMTGPLAVGASRDLVLNAGGGWM
jgi:hypothetical protein